MRNPKDTASVIHARIVAYNNVFQKENVFTRSVLEDLARFCRANESTFHVDPRGHALLEGRREVFLRIQEYLNLDVEQIMTLHKIKNMVQKSGG